MQSVFSHARIFLFLAFKVGYTEKPQKFIFYKKDCGIGISKEYFDKIFGIFQRRHGKGEYHGAVIGLAL